jgi:hypothetical protein
MILLSCPYEEGCSGMMGAGAPASRTRAGAGATDRGVLTTPPPLSYPFTDLRTRGSLEALSNITIHILSLQERGILS